MGQKKIGFLANLKCLRHDEKINFHCFRWKVINNNNSMPPKISLMCNNRLISCYKCCLLFALIASQILFFKYFVVIFQFFLSYYKGLEFSKPVKWRRKTWALLFHTASGKWCENRLSSRQIRTKVWTFYTLTSVCIFSIVFFIHFLRCWQGEFVEQSRATLVGDHFLLFSWPQYVIQGWYCKEKLDASHS